MDEDYDELMGPTTTGGSGTVRTNRASAGPPSNLFQSMPDRWAQREARLNDAEARQTTARKTTTTTDIMGFEEEEEGAVDAASPQGIRQEALRMLEVAESGTYSVHRTVTGGFMAEPRSMGNNKRVPTALAGLGSFSNPAARSSKPRVPTMYRDEPPTQEDYEYGDYDDARFADQQVREEKKEASSSWSSRYSVDDTLLNLSGGSVQSPPSAASRSGGSNSFLDRLDRAAERQSARNMFKSNSPTKNAKVFGAGFNFRQKNVFGKQGVAASPENNLRAAWMDAGSPASHSPARSWMDDLQAKRNRRRNYMILAALLCAFLVAMVAFFGGRSKGSSGSSASSTLPQGNHEAISFYITSDIPLNGEEEEALKDHLASLSNRGDFLVHLGNIQDVSRTHCSRYQYQAVADILMESPVPVFVLPGQDDWNNCPDQDKAWYFWSENFLEFDDYFDKKFTMMRQQNYLENFAFHHGGVLFIAVHETDGRIDDEDELAERNARNVEWVEGIVNTYLNHHIRALVIFGNSRPLRSSNDDFYLGMLRVLYEVEVPVAYIHANDRDGNSSITYKPFNMDGMEHITAIQSARGGTKEPMRIHVGFDEVDPFIVG